MKKLLTYLLFSVAYSPFCWGQDTLVFNTHKGDGTKNWKPYFLVSGGTSNPWTFSGYGANSYYSSYDGYGYSGYAYNGSDFSLTAGLKDHRGWEFTGMVSYIRNEFDASGIMTETVADFFLNGNTSLDVNNVNAIGNYYYNNFSLLAGITKSWGGGKFIGAGFSLMFGDFITATPALHGIAKGFSMNGSPASCYFNMNSELQSNFVTELSFHIDFPLVTSNFFLRFLIEFQLTGLTNSGGYQYIDMNTGNTLYAGSYTGGNASWNYNSFFVGLTDLTAGLGYTF